MYQKSGRQQQGRRFANNGETRTWNRYDNQRDNRGGKRYFDEETNEVAHMKRPKYGNRKNGNFDNYPSRHMENYGYSNGANEVKEEQEDTIKDGKEDHMKAKEYYKNAKFKSFRLIIRNLPFKTIKEDIQNVCSNFGPFSEIVLPPSKKMEGKCAGFCFVQFKNKESADKAKEYFNTNKFNGRMVAADWALAKDTYETSAHNEKLALESKVKEEQNDIKPEAKLDSDSGGEESEESEEEAISNPSSPIKRPDKGKKIKEEPNKTDTAVEEERVVFLRNLSFETKEDSLKKAISKFGTVELAIICKFKDSGHSKGTAFVHFSTKEEAQACITACENTDFIIDGQTVKIMLAVPRERAAEIEKEAHKKLPSDNRNLRLLRFGLIREGTSAAAGMSATDSAKREKLAQSARKKLENLNMLVSPVRLVVHNVPLNMNDAKLLEICKEAGGVGAYVTECRIWKDTERLNAKGEARSKGFAFVTFKEHTHALNCLQKLNNNPKTFTNDKRPIVEFSVENIKILQTKERRVMQSRGEKIDNRVLNEKVKKQVRESIGKIHLSGMKFLPKSLGKKMRHRDLSNKKKKKMGLLKKDKKNAQKAPAEESKKKKSTKKTLTKSLALSF